MPAVYTFSRSDNQILQELMRVFSSGRGTSREQWSIQAELLMEPVGWDAVWKLSKDFCKRFGVRFPCIAFVTVTAVDFQNLSACVDVLSVQHKSMTLPEAVVDVPFIELWPTIDQREKCIDTATTADFIDLLRFYYNEIWMPWDDQLEKDDKILISNTIEQRMTLWSEMHNGSIPTCVSRPLISLRNAAINAYEKLKDLDSSLCEDDLASDDDSLLPPNYITLCAEMNAKLEGLMAKWTLYENPVVREQFFIKEMDKYRMNRDKKNVVALWRGGSVQDLEAISRYLRGRVGAAHTVSVLASAEEALTLEPEQLVLCSHQHELPDMPLMDIAICSFNGSSLVASEVRSCLLVLHSICSIQDVTLRCARVSTVLLARSGDLRLTRCSLVDDQQTEQSYISQGIVAMAGAKIVLEDCTLENFYTGIVVHKGAEVELRNCTIRQCGVGVQMYPGSRVLIDGSAVTDCNENCIRCEVDDPTPVSQVEGLTVMPNCKIGSGNIEKDILTIKQDVNIM